MRCTNCSYPLWDIAARTCPECGEGFSPADYEFPPCGVRFCCPACDHAHEGTDARGQIGPGEFACDGCGAPMSAAVAVVRLRPEASDKYMAVQQLPWLDRSRLGFWRAWWKTFALSLASRRNTIRGTPMGSSAMQAVWYSIASMCVLMSPHVATSSYLLISALLSSQAGSPDASEQVGFALGYTHFMLWTAGIMVVWLPLWIVTTHAVLCFTGDVHAPMRRTAHALCYSTGLNFIFAVPFFGLFFMIFMLACWPLCAATMLAEAQRVPRWRALLAVLSMHLTILVWGYLRLVFG
ncbi:MAG: hypothetical protein KF859_06850 [Phycisphaeraceae bacterium]|nr:hypothetical protein [Phycisphaeraceae bacterium]